MPIDAIWVSPGVQVTRGGCCAFDDPWAAPSHHHLLWIEIFNLSLLGKALTAHRKIKANRLDTKDPWLVRHCNSRVYEACNKQDIFESISALWTLLVAFQDRATDLLPDTIKVHNELQTATRCV